MSYIKKDHTLRVMDSDDWELLKQEGTLVAAAEMSATTQIGLKWLEQLVDGGLQVPEAALRVFRRTLEDFKKYEDCGAGEEHARNVLINIIEEFVEHRYGIELDSFWWEPC